MGGRNAFDLTRKLTRRLRGIQRNILVGAGGVRNNKHAVNKIAIKHNKYKAKHMYLQNTQQISSYALPYAMLAQCQLLLTHPAKSQNLIFTKVYW